MSPRLPSGYASTVHTAQGVTADTMHGVATGGESRQQLYTMITRGRSANHIYVSVVGDGDPHTLIRPDTIQPSTATELLEQILARDGSPRSASTLLGDQQAPRRPARRIRRTLPRRPAHGRRRRHRQQCSTSSGDLLANRLVPGLSEEPAWPTLRGHLLLAAAGADPIAELFSAAAQWGPDQRP